MKFLAENESNDILENLVFNYDSKEENVIFVNELLFKNTLNTSQPVDLWRK